MLSKELHSRILTGGEAIKKILPLIDEERPELESSTMHAAIEFGKRALANIDKITETDPQWVRAIKLRDSKTNPMDIEAVRKVFKEASHNQNISEAGDFFIYFGELLKGSVITLEQFKKELNPKYAWIIEHWIVKREAPLQLNLCYYSDKAICRLLSCVQAGILSNADSHDWSINLLRSVYINKLRLRRSRFILYQDVVTDGGELFSIPFRKGPRIRKEKSESY